MEEAARKFARRILAIHLALLALVISIVYVASREVYDSTRKQSTEQAQSRQSLLAAQTARGIESFYQSIFNDLDLLREADGEYADETPGGDQTTPPQPAGPRLNWKEILSLDPKTALARNPVLRTLFASVLWRQLDGRVTHLFILDRKELERAEQKAGGIAGGRGTANSGISILGPQQNHRPDPREIVAKSRDWIMGVKQSTISRYQQHEADGKTVGLNLICIPMTERNPRLLVAAVDVRFPRAKFIDGINTDQESTVAILIDDAGTIMATAATEQIGRRAIDLLEDDLKPLGRRFLGTGQRGSAIIDRPHKAGEREYPPALFNIEPVTIAGKKWTMMMITPLSEVDAVVSRVFKKALFWAVFVIISMTAILVSTSIQLIRSRIRMERLRHDVLSRELTQAREIQLAWLPRDKISVPSIDIAAINHPASHISGDFYNWFELPDGRTVVTIGDVTGHGMGAAFLMATTQLLVHATMLRLQDPGKTLHEVNNHLTMQMFNGQFVTMLICVLDVDEGTLEIATAGHEAPILGSDGRFHLLPIEYHLVMGIEKNVEYPTERYDLPESASLILFTDGVTDARDTEGKRFDLDRLIHTLDTGQASSAQHLLDSIVGRINQFRQTRELPDDLTLVCIQTLAQRAFKSSEVLTV